MKTAFRQNNPWGLKHCSVFIYLYHKVCKCCWGCIQQNLAVGKKIKERHVYRFSQKPLINTEGQMNTDIQTQKI